MQKLPSLLCCQYINGNIIELRTDRRVYSVGYKICEYLPYHDRECQYLMHIHNNILVVTAGGYAFIYRLCENQLRDTKFETISQGENGTIEFIKIYGDEISLYSYDSEDSYDYNLLTYNIRTGQTTREKISSDDSWYYQGTRYIGNLNCCYTVYNMKGRIVRNIRNTGCKC